MPNRILNAHTLIGSGIGGATGLAINRLALGNKSLLSNLIATGLGGALGGTAGYLLNKHLRDTSDPKDKVIKDNASKPAGEMNTEILTQVRDAVKDGSSSEKAIALRNKLRANGMGDSDIQELFNAAEYVKDGFELRPFSRATAGVAGMAASDWVFRKARDIVTGKDAKGNTGGKDGNVSWVYAGDAQNGPMKIKIDPTERTVSVEGTSANNNKPGKKSKKSKKSKKYSVSDLNRITDPVLRTRIADELTGDVRVKQGWFYRHFGTPSERRQAQFIHDNVTKHRLENAPGIKKLLAKLNAGNMTNPMAMKLRNVVNRIGKVYVPAGTGKRLARVGGRGARLTNALGGGLLGLLLESSMHEANPKLIKRFRDLD